MNKKQIEAEIRLKERDLKYLESEHKREIKEDLMVDSKPLLIRVRKEIRELYEELNKKWKQ